MAHFEDCEQRRWTLRVTTAAIERVREEIGLDLADPTGEAFNRLANDPCLLVRTLWTLCEDQAKRSDVAARSFGEALYGDAIDEATAALLDAVADFFPSRRREILRRIRQKTAEAQTAAEERVFRKMDDPALAAQINAALDRQMQAEIERLLTRFGSPTS